MAKIGLSLKLLGVEKLIKKLDSKTVRDPLLDSIKKAAITIQNLVKEASPRDTGTMAQRVTHQLHSDPGNLYARVYSPVDYTSYVEEGTRPHYPPVEPIIEWARRHGMPKSAGYAIVQKIGKFGTEAAHKEGAMVVKGQGRFPYALEKVKDKVGTTERDLAKKIEVEFDKR